MNLVLLYKVQQNKGWRMVKSETCRDPCLKIEPETQAISEPNKKKKISLRDLVGTLPRFRDWAEIFRAPQFSENSENYRGHP